MQDWDCLVEDSLYTGIKQASKPQNPQQDDQAISSEKDRHCCRYQRLCATAAFTSGTPHQSSISPPFPMRGERTNNSHNELWRKKKWFCANLTDGTKELPVRTSSSFAREIFRNPLYFFISLHVCSFVQSQQAQELQNDKKFKFSKPAREMSMT